jgi:hypothetical protein
MGLAALRTFTFSSRTDSASKVTGGTEDRHDPRFRDPGQALLIAQHVL